MATNKPRLQCYITKIQKEKLELIMNNFPGKSHSFVVGELIDNYYENHQVNVSNDKRNDDEIEVLDLESEVNYERY